MLSYFFSVFNLRVIENFSFYEVVVSSVNYNAPFFLTLSLSDFEVRMNVPIEEILFRHLSTAASLRYSDHLKRCFGNIGTSVAKEYQAILLKLVSIK